MTMLKTRPITNNRSTAVPAWILCGITSVQRAEGIPIRWGNRTVETLENIRRGLEPSMADRLASQGFDMVVLHGASGLGLDGDRPNILATKPLSAALKRNGLKRVAYTQAIGFVYYEALQAERPESINWLQRQPNGEHPYYYTAWFWKVPCLNNPDFIAYLKELFRFLMRELDLDGLFLDNFGYHSYSCYCDHCKSRFRKYLYSRYPTAEARYERFEMTNLDYIDPPPFHHLSGCSFDNNGVPEETKMIEPVSQEWIRFRCERAGEIAREFNDCIKECNPDAILYLNYMYGGAPGMNNSVFHGLWPEFIYPNADLVLAEVAGPPSINDAGVLHSRIPMMKTAKHFGIPMSTCSFHRELKDFRRIYLAEGMAFNTAPVDLVGDVERDDPPDWMQAYKSFYREHRTLLGGAATVADCAILHNFESLSYACSYPQESLVLCEQSLIQGGFTFDIIFDQGLNNLDKYPVLFLANVICLSRPVIERIADYVRAGGAVVATEDTSCFNERFIPWRGAWPHRMFKIPLLGELLGIEWPKSEMACCEVGQGRIAVLPAIERPWRDAAGGGPGRYPSPVDMATHSYGPAMPGVLRLPALSAHHDDIGAAMEYALNGRRTLIAEARGPLLTEVTHNHQGTFIHLLNWDHTAPIDSIQLSLRWSGDPPASVERISPDAETPSGLLPFQLKEGRIDITLPDLLCYSVGVIKPGPMDREEPPGGGNGWS